MRFLIVLMVSCATVNALSLADEPQKMNVLFIASDDLNTDLGCYGHPELLSHPTSTNSRPRGSASTKRTVSIPFAIRVGHRSLTGLRPDTLKIYENAHAVPQNQARTLRACHKRFARVTTSSLALASSTITACRAQIGTRWPRRSRFMG